LVILAKSEKYSKEDGIRSFKVNLMLVPGLVRDCCSLLYKKSNDHPRSWRPPRGSHRGL